jgi:hypothetical protein
MTALFSALPLIALATAAVVATMPLYYSVRMIVVRVVRG